MKKILWRLTIGTKGETRYIFQNHNLTIKWLRCYLPLLHRGTTHVKYKISFWCRLSNSCQGSPTFMEWISLVWWIAKSLDHLHIAYTILFQSDEYTLHMFYIFSKFFFFSIVKFLNECERNICVGNQCYICVGNVILLSKYQVVISRGKVQKIHVVFGPPSTLFIE